MSFVVRKQVFLKRKYAFQVTQYEHLYVWKGKLGINTFNQDSNFEFK